MHGTTITDKHNKHKHKTFDTHVNFNKCEQRISQTNKTTQDTHKTTHQNILNKSKSHAQNNNKQPNTINNNTTNTHEQDQIHNNNNTTPITKPNDHQQHKNTSTNNQ